MDKFNTKTAEYNQQTGLNDVDELTVEYFDVAAYYPSSSFFVVPHNVDYNIPSLIDQMLLSNGPTARTFIDFMESLIPWSQAGTPCIDINTALDVALPTPRHEL